MPPAFRPNAYVSVDPTTGKAGRRFPLLQPSGVKRVLERATRAQGHWAARSIAERAAFLRRVGETLRTRAEALAMLIAEEMGKPLQDGRAEVHKSAGACDYFAEHAAALLTPARFTNARGRMEERWEPIGVVLGVMPWNYPFWQVLRFAVPALVGGNVVVVKHAPNVPRCALAIEAVFEESGVPRGVYQNAFLSVADVHRLVRDARVAGVSLTGSTQAGDAIAATAGAVNKPCVTELGGSDPFVVLADADLPAAVQALITARLANAGQSCIAAKRVIVARERRAELEALLPESVRALRVGPPKEPGVKMGPMARADLRAKLHAQVRRAVREGARVLVGGALPQGPGFFYPPTVLAGRTAKSVAFREELFGPVIALSEARDAQAALALANQTDFGLGASVWTQDAEQAERFVRGFDAGVVAVNRIVESTYEVGFGGRKRSGKGRELGGEGLRAFLQQKTVLLPPAT